MRILAVDDKSMPLKALVSAISEASPDAQVVACSNGADALALPDADRFDVAFIDIDMPKMNGIELARRLKALNPKINIVFATGYGDYMADAFEMHSSGYLLKPVTAEAVAVELDNLRYPQPVPKLRKTLVVRCFGNFEAFADGKPVAFKRNKTKEMLAYLIDRRGSIVSLHEVEAVLWEDIPLSGRLSGSYLRTLISDLRQSISACGIDDVLVRRRGAIGIDASRISCDYYDYLAGDPLAIAMWHGEYMSQYPWAEATLAGLML